MVAFLVIFGFLALGAAVVGWATRHTWDVSALARTIAGDRTPYRSRQVRPRAADPIRIDPTPTHPIRADTVPVDPFAHAPSMTPPAFAESETRH